MADVNRDGIFKVKLSKDVERLGRKAKAGTTVENLGYQEALSLHAAGFADAPVEQKAEAAQPAK